MITPRFHIEQTEMDVIFTIHAPYASIADAEVYADLDIFCFYASPYYLRLHLPGFIEETDASKGSYDADKGTFVLCVQKITRGEHFGGLDFVTALLTPRNNSKRKEVKPVIEVVGNHIENSSSEEEYSDEEDWYIDQCPFEEPSDDFLLTAPHYGFANKVSGAFQNFKTEFLEIIELSDPDKTPASSRSKLRASHESENFSDDHYLADWLQTELIEPLLTFKAQWESDSSVPFLDEEIDTLKDFPKKEFLLNKREERFAFLSLIDILFAYAYNSRSTMEENTVESAWTVNKLSATLSWFQNFSTAKEAVLVPIRRSLCYPLFRNWELSIKVLDDTKRILHLGKHQILKSLLEIYAMFNNSEPRYLLNQLYIRDYCIWIQHVSDSQIKSLSSNLEKVHLCKADVELDLEELETAAKLVQLEEKMSEKKAVGETDGSFHGLSSEERLCHKISVLSVSEKGMKKNIPRPGRADDSVSSKDSEDDSSSSDEESSSSFSSSSSTSLDSDDLSDTETNKPAEVPRIE